MLHTDTWPPYNLEIDTLGAILFKVVSITMLRPGVQIGALHDLRTLLGVIPHIFCLAASKSEEPSPCLC